MRTLNARASPSSDVNAKNAIHARAFPTSDAKDKNQRSHPKDFDKLRLASWNLGTMTGRSTELSEILKTRQINACCVQETKWKGSKSRDIGNGYQLVYHGVDTKRNGVGIVLDENLKTRVIDVVRKNDRLISIKLAMDGQPPLNLISAYAPQTGCSEQEKHDFWEDFDEIMQNIPLTEHAHIGGDLNGHVGEKNDLHSDTHGGYGFGTRNKQGISILNFASRLLVSVMKLPKPITTHISRADSIKWKELHSIKGSPLLEWAHAYMKEDIESDKSANQMWSDFERLCLEGAKEILGISRGARRIGKETSWWNETAQHIIKSKREAFKAWQKSGLEEDHLLYKNLKKIAKSAVAQSMAKSREDFYDRLENAEDENSIYKIARQRHRSTLDIKCNKFIKNAQGPIKCIVEEEVSKAISKMKHHKTTGPDQIPADLWKKLKESATPWLTKLFNAIIKDP
ncbi:uncharacterized protein LOC124542478 [Vanessa cardui]|uniref:uncharacterized protein LOC124542478 n=1 Tax=Vanessa cardui TaxID=171605 RepID=UPI001F1434E4|nr:uncharacterized protein LOC124542478 [Vanessa cardui]